jgi:hypothetical protein
MEFLLTRDGGAVPILIEECAFEGVRRIGEAVASDIELVTGLKPRLITEKALSAGKASDAGKGSVTGREPDKEKPPCVEETVIFCATWGNSLLLKQLAEQQAKERPVTEGSPESGNWSGQEDSEQKGRRGLAEGLKSEDWSGQEDSGQKERSEPEKCSELLGLEGKREVYKIFFAENPFPGVGQALVICGSDKRGTIYGMFALSEYLGVTPLVYWGDSAPKRQERPVIREDICTLSKEPSVYYRGFFINDEWPCFGTWVTEHFGDFNAQAYRYVFEFLLRMRGNYLWPAMWTASFPLDGPGGANEELADIYGVIMGYSHHEPCLRASEEWDKVRGEDSPYGNEWNFYTNEQGLLRYWEDALKRSGKYENVITIGMRGERDSSMLGDDAGVAENVALLKDIIRKQRGLIRRNVNEDLSKVPQMLALYKEVEAYFYGDESVPGLKDWEELDDVICMLCEDNFGHMRTLPTKDIRNHSGGFGMYYHYDYHGGPISYEWIDSTPLSKTWEQMCMAYEYGIRKLWIVNVGDVKFHEVPLTYFMNLAYDYEKWGITNPHSAEEFTEKWAAENFGITDKTAEVFTRYTNLLSLRRPESLNDKIYHPCHFLESDHILEQVLEVEKASCEIYGELPEQDKKGYYSMVHYPLMAGMNLMKMHLYAGKNRHYAEQGRFIANEYGRLAEQCIARDAALAEEFGHFENGKWNGMQLAPHIGFTKWNEDGCRYPVLSRVTPISKPRLSVSRKDGRRVCYKNYGAPEAVKIHDFLSAGCDKVLLELANDGGGTLHCRIVPEEGELPGWLEVRVKSISGDPDRNRLETVLELEGGTSRSLGEVEICCLRSKLPEGMVRKRLLVTDGDTIVAVDIAAQRTDTEKLPPMTFLPKNGIVVMDAKHYARKEDVEGAGFRVLEHYGKYGSGMKVFPVTASFGEPAAPRLTYQFVLEKSGSYQVELLAAPTNSPVQGQAVRLRVSAGDAGEKTAELVTGEFRAGDHRDEEWCKGVLDQIRVAVLRFDLEAGLQQLTVSAMEAGAVLERIRIYPAGKELPESYLGPGESFHT